LEIENNMKKLEYTDKFSYRHIGPSENELSEMLKIIGVDSTDELINKTIPENIRLDSGLNLDEPETEYEFIQNLKSVASQNSIFKTFIGLGYYDTITPAVIQRNIFEIKKKTHPQPLLLGREGAKTSYFQNF